MHNFKELYSRLKTGYIPNIRYLKQKLRIQPISSTSEECSSEISLDVKNCSINKAYTSSRRSKFYKR